MAVWRYGGQPDYGGMTGSNQIKKWGGPGEAGGRSLCGECREFIRSFIIYLFYFKLSGDQELMRLGLLVICDKGAWRNKD